MLLLTLLKRPPGWRIPAAMLLIALLLVTPTKQVYGQSTGPIEVLSYQNETNFPNNLVIGVTAKGQHEIVEVRVYYRPENSGVWAYGYSDFTPSRQVIARFKIPASGASYVPPGARIEYYYSVRDARGNLHETPVKVAEYSDTRFQWDRAHIGPLTLFYHDVPKNRVDALSQELEKEMQRLQDLLQLEVQQPIRGFIYNGFAEALPAFPSQSRTITEEEVFHGFAFSAHQVFLGVGLQARLIVHETAHLMLAQALDSGSGRAPSWLDEGFATYVEPGSNPVSGQSLSSLGPPLRAMATVAGTPTEINYFYLKSESVVSFLINEYGTQSFQNMLGELRQGHTIDVALVHVYGFDTDGLEAKWAVSTAGRASPSPGRPSPATPFLLFNTWLLGGLILVVMALVLVRHVFRKLRPSTEDKDWESPWEE